MSQVKIGAFMLTPRTQAALKMIFPGSVEAVRWKLHQWTCPIIRNGLEKLKAKELLYGVNISRRYHYVYIDNPKTGCSSLKSALVELELKDGRSDLDYLDWQVFHNRDRSPLLRMNDWRGGMSLSGLAAKRYRFATFVRNPYTRLLSCYRDKVLRNKSHKLLILQALGHPADKMDAPVSFEEFVGAVIKQTDLEMDPHWRVQSSQILFDRLEFAFIGRFERYAEDFLEFFRQIGVPETELPESRHLNRTREGRVEGCRDYYTSDLQAKVYSRYQADFNNFGYSYDLPD